MNISLSGGAFFLPEFSKYDSNGGVVVLYIFYNILCFLNVSSGPSHFMKQGLAISMRILDFPPDEWSRIQRKAWAFHSIGLAISMKTLGVSLGRGSASYKQLVFASNRGL